MVQEHGEQFIITDHGREAVRIDSRDPRRSMSPVDRS